MIASEDDLDTIEKPVKSKQFDQFGLSSIR